MNLSQGSKAAPKEFKDQGSVSVQVRSVVTVIEGL